MTDTINPKLGALRVIHDKIVFTFVEDIRQGQLVDKTEWGFEFQVSQNNTKQPPRWGFVHSVGDTVNEHLPPEKHIKPGSYILIEALMWTEGMMLEDVKFWYTSVEKLMAMSNTLPT